MCARYNLRATPHQLIEIFQLLREPVVTPRFNIAPTQQIAVVRRVDKHRELSMMRWGLVPSWSKDVKAGPPLVNARGDTVATKPAFRSAFKKRRCLVPASGFYEWQKGDGKTKQPFHIHLKREPLFAFAGLWECWKGGSEPLESATIITTDANELMLPIHDRMPVILPEEAYETWLDPDVDAKRLESLLRSFPATEMVADPISTVVNNVRNETPAVLEASA